MTKSNTTASLLERQKNGFNLIFANFCRMQKIRDAENLRAKNALDTGNTSAVITIAKNQKTADYINNNQLSLINLFKSYTISPNYAFQFSAGRGKTYEAIHKTEKGEKRVFVSNFTITGLYVDGVFYRSNFKYGTRTTQALTIYQENKLHLYSCDTKRVKFVSNEELFDLLKKYKVIKEGAYAYDFDFLADKYPNYKEMLQVKATI